MRKFKAWAYPKQICILGRWLQWRQWSENRLFNSPLHFSGKFLNAILYVFVYSILSLELYFAYAFKFRKLWNFFRKYSYSHSIWFCLSLSLTCLNSSYGHMHFLHFYVSLLTFVLNSWFTQFASPGLTPLFYWAYCLLYFSP